MLLSILLFGFDEQALGKRVLYEDTPENVKAGPLYEYSYVVVVEGDLDLLESDNSFIEAAKRKR